ncbi:MAG: DAK2 domain-containing protein, partial [Firmicutes bacterium]|nr:DAK2 domain-containing protein [Bacillota bacterium]
AKAPEAKCGVVAVCSGDGLAEIFTQMGAVVLQGGQTMNPSAEDILKLVSDMNTEETVILPNNSNIILTANQIQSLTDKKIAVVNSKFVTHGIAAMVEFNKDASAEDNAAVMTEAFSAVHSGELTYAVRDSKYAGMEIAENDLLALAEGKIVSHGKDMQQVLKLLFEEMTSGEDKDDLSLITLFYGNDMSEAEAQEIADMLEELYPDMDIDMHFGGQPLYYFLLSVE